jgi:hypothetical protein
VEDAGVKTNWRRFIRIVFWKNHMDLPYPHAVKRIGRAWERDYKVIGVLRWVLY